MELNNRALKVAFNRAVSAAIGSAIAVGIWGVVTGDYSTLLPAVAFYTAGRATMAYDYENQLDKAAQNVDVPAQEGSDGTPPHLDMK